jgi:5-methylcytosine-specific restriction enzyme subunit McrC
MARAIPARNIFYLLLYAWNRLPEGRLIDVEGVASPELPNLLAKILVNGLRHLQRRGLDRHYIEIDEDLSCPRGRMRLTDTIGRGLLIRPQIACTTDNFSRDVLHNRIVKSTLGRLARLEAVDRKLREEISNAVLELSDIGSIEITSRDFGRVQLHGNNAVYGLLLRVCALIHEGLMPDSAGGRFQFRALFEDPQTMGLIFQDFVRNFYAIEQTGFRVKGESFAWPLDDGYGHGQSLMPSMNTDVSLHSALRTIIIECKWTGTTLQRGRLQSNHLYQLSAYMRHHGHAAVSPSTVEGILLYPLTDEAVDVSVRIHNQSLRVRTLDLMRDWQEIHHDLLGLLAEPTA